MLNGLESRDPSVYERLPVKTAFPNLDVVAASAAATLNPADVIGGRPVREFVEWAVRAYDRVIIDSPPFGLVSDAAVLAGLTDCVIMVCRPSRTRKRALGYAVRHFQDMGANVIGVIVNDVELAGGFHFGEFNHYGVYSSDSYSQVYGQAPKK